MYAVTLEPYVTRVEAAGDDTVLDALRRAGWRSPYKCRRGGCGVCKARLLRGELRYARPVAETVLSPDERAHGMCLPCRAIPTTDVVIELDGAPLRAVLATVTSPTTPHGQQGD